jgi:hypothetical protein
MASNNELVEYTEVNSLRNAGLKSYFVKCFAWYSLTHGSLNHTVK